MLWKLAVTLIVGCGAMLADSTIDSETVYEWSTGPVASKAVAIRSVPLTESLVREICSQTGSKLAAAHKLWTLYIFSSKDDARQYLYGRPAIDSGYDSWLRLYGEFSRKQLPMAEVFGLGKNIVFRIRDAGNQIQKQEFQGSDFLSINREGRHFEILDISLHALAPHSKPSADRSCIVEVYISGASMPSIAEARLITRDLRRSIAQVQVFTEFRDDVFFPVSNFPVVYRFANARTPPAERQYYSKRSVGCASDASWVRCQ